MKHREIRYRAINQNGIHWQEEIKKGNKIALQFFGYLTLFSVIIAGIIAVWDHSDEIDSNAKMALDIIGFLILVTFGVWRVSKMVKR